MELSNAIPTKYLEESASKKERAMAAEAIEAILLMLRL